MLLKYSVDQCKIISQGFVTDRSACCLSGISETWSIGAKVVIFTKEAEGGYVFFPACVCVSVRP